MVSPIIRVCAFHRNQLVAAVQATIGRRYSRHYAENEREVGLHRHRDTICPLEGYCAANVERGLTVIVTGCSNWNSSIVSAGILICCPRVTPFQTAPPPAPTPAPIAAPAPPPAIAPMIAPTAAPPPTFAAVFLPRELPRAEYVL